MPRRSSLWRRDRPREGSVSASASAATSRGPSPNPGASAPPKLSLRHALSVHKNMGRGGLFGSAPVQSPDGLPVESDAGRLGLGLVTTNLSASASGSGISGGMEGQEAEHQRGSSVDVGGPRFGGSGMHHDVGVRRAGESAVYANGLVRDSFSLFTTSLT